MRVNLFEMVRGLGTSGVRGTLLREVVESYLNGATETGKTVVRDYVSATRGFHALEKHTDIPAKSQIRMLRTNGTPSAENPRQHWGDSSLALPESSWI